jgi:hypothetical protein
VVAEAEEALIAAAAAMSASIGFVGIASGVAWIAMLAMAGSPAAVGMRMVGVVMTKSVGVEEPHEESPL